MPPALGDAFSSAGEASLQRRLTEHHKLPKSARIGRICLECAAIFRHLPLTVRCRLGDYTRTMMIKHILTICAAATAGAAGTSLAHGATGLSGATRVGLFVGAPALSARRLSGRLCRGPGVPDFDALEDDEAPQCGRAAAARSGHVAGRSALRASAGAPPVYSTRRPVRSSRPMIRAMAAQPALRRSTPTAHADRSGPFAR